MPTRKDTKRVEKRLPAAKRKYQKAIDRFMNISVFEWQNSFAEFRPGKSSVEFTTFFLVAGDSTKYRFDYEMNLLNPLPSVHTIRDLLWFSLKDYSKTSDAAHYM